MLELQSHILDGRLVRAELKKALIEKVNTRPTPPCLAIVQVGDRPDSTAFIAAKRSFALSIGVKEVHIHFPEQIAQDELVKKIGELNSDKTIHGIIVQLPLPAHLDRDTVIESIDPAKDVDGLTSANIKSGRVMPATARGIGELLDFYHVELDGKRVTVVGRSALVGTPVARLCEKRGAIVTVCHRKTPRDEFKKAVMNAEILIVAAGQPKLITEDMVNAGQVIVDVGINKVNGIMVGDVDYVSVEPKVAAITPVPGGVGQMTVLALFENLVDAWYNQDSS